MSIIKRKQKAGPVAELTKLKLRWRDSFSEAEREHWRAVFLSGKSREAIREEIAQELKIHLRTNHPLHMFRKWEQGQRDRDEEAERMQDDNRRVIEELGPNATLEEIRDEVLRRSYERSLATGNFKQGLATVQHDMKVRAQSLTESKFKESVRDKLHAGLDAVADAFKENEDAMKLYQQARALIARETR